MALSRPRVLIGFADALAAIESAWSLQDAGFEVVAFARRGRPPALARAPGVRVVPVTAPERDVKATLADLRRAAAAEAPAAVLPLDDHAVWLVDRLAADDVTVTVAGPTGDLAALALDKRRQLAAASAAGLAVPPTADGTGASPVPAGTTGPWVVKSALAVAERDGRLARPAGTRAASATEVTAAAAAIGGPVLVQPVVDGVGEGVFGLATERGIEAWSAHRRVRMMNPRGSGSSACRSIRVADDVRAPVAAFVAATGWRGLFMVELLRDGAGTAWTMELNGRPWGSMALARHRGFAYPSWAVRLALDPAFSPRVPVAPPEVTARHLGRELVHVAAVARAALRRTGDGPSLGRTLVEVCRLGRDDRWYNWRPGASRVLAADTVATLRSQLSRGRGS